MAYSNPGMRENLKKKIMAGSKGGPTNKWTARKAQMLAQQYKAKGGGYKGAKTAKQKSLSKWTKEEWGTKSGKPSTQGPKATGERYLPKKAIKKLSAAEYKATSDKKRAGIKAGKKSVANTPKAKKASKAARKAR